MEAFQYGWGVFFVLVGWFVGFTDAGSNPNSVVTSSPLDVHIANRADRMKALHALRVHHSVHICIYFKTTPHHTTPQ